MYLRPKIMILSDILMAVWTALVAVGFIFGATFPGGSVPRIAEFLKPFRLYLPAVPGPSTWLINLASPACSIALALFIVVAARGAGKAVSRLIPFPRGSTWWLGLAAGGGMLSFIYFGFGLAGIVFPALLFAVLIPFAILGMAGFSMNAPEKSGFRGFIRLAAALTAAAWILGVLIPEPGIDAYLYHLRLPFYYTLHHKVYTVWHHIHGHVPQIWEILLMVFPRELAATGAQALSALCAVAVWRMAVQRGGGGWGYRAGLILVLSSPLVTGIGTSAYTDLPLMWLGFGSYLLLVPSSGGPSKSSLFWAGAVLGLATSLKYASFPAFAAATVLLALMSRRRGSFLYPVPAISGFLAVFWPWLAWNGLETGNPFFPFLARIFPSSLPPLPFADRLSAAVFSRTAWNMLQAPWNALIRCEPALFLTPILVAAVPFLVAKKRAGAAVPPMTGLWAFSFLGAWAVFMADERFLLGAVPVLLLLLPRLDEFRRGRAVFAVLFALNMAGFCRQQMVPLGRIWAATGMVSRQEYLSGHVAPSPGFMEAASWLNKNTGTDDRILFVSDFKSPYIWRECIHDHVYDYPTRLVYLLWNCRPDPERLGIRFRQLGIRWVVYLPTVNSVRLAQMPDLFSFNPRNSRVWGGFWRKSAVIRAAFPPVFVYQLSGKPGKPGDVYHFPGVADAGLLSANDLLRTRGRTAYIDYLRRLLQAYPWVGEFHQKLGEALVTGDSISDEVRMHLNRAARSTRQ